MARKSRSAPGPDADVLTEIDRFFRKTRRVIVPLSVREILDEEIAKKLA